MFGDPANVPIFDASFLDGSILLAIIAIIVVVLEYRYREKEARIVSLRSRTETLIDLLGDFEGTMFELIPAKTTSSNAYQTWVTEYNKTIQILELAKNDPSIDNLAKARIQNDHSKALKEWFVKEDLIRSGLAAKAAGLEARIRLRLVGQGTEALRLGSAVANYLNVRAEALPNKPTMEDTHSELLRSGRELIAKWNREADKVRQTTAPNKPQQLP